MIWEVMAAACVVALVAEGVGMLCNEGWLIDLGLYIALVALGLALGHVTGGVI